jgi:hypothetical protein
MLFLLDVESVPILDTRLPKVQVGPNAARRKAGCGPAVLENLWKKDTIEKAMEELKQDTRRMFQFLYDDLALHVSRTGQSRKRVPSQLRPVTGVGSKSEGRREGQSSDS